MIIRPLSTILVNLLVVAGGFQGSRLNAAQPNVVIFFTDDQGILDVNCFLRQGL